MGVHRELATYEGSPATVVVVRGLLVVLVMLTACAVDAPQPVVVGLSAIESFESFDTEMMSALEATPAEPDLCALAAELPADDLCSLICDPAALHQAMIDEGVATGRCYLLLCQLSEDVHASVGVCLVN